MQQYLFFLIAPTVICLTAVVLVWLATRNRKDLFTDDDMKKYLEDNRHLFDKPK